MCTWGSLGLILQSACTLLLAAKKMLWLGYYIMLYAFVSSVNGHDN